MRFNIKDLNESFDRKFNEILTEAKQVAIEKFNEFYSGIITWEEFSKAEFKNKFKRLEEYQKGDITLSCDWLPKHVSREKMASLVDRANKRLEKSGMVEAEYENKAIPAPKHELSELLVMTDGEYKLYACDCVEDSIMLGRGSNWCHTGHHDIPKGYVKVSQAKLHFDDIQPHTTDGKFYFIYKNDQPMYALHKEKNDKIYMMDIDDNSINIDDYIQYFPKICEYFGHKDWSDEIYYWDGESIVPSNVVTVVIDEHVTYIKSKAFATHHLLQSIKIPNSVTFIGYKAFDCCRSLQSIEISSSLDSIGDSAFSYCKSLKSLMIPNSVTYIGIDAFVFCTSLETIEIPNSVVLIEDSVFVGCDSLKSIKLSSSIDLIEDYTFADCKSLQSIKIPNSVTSIGKRTFDSCSSLRSIEIPDSVISIGWKAFYECSNLVIYCNKGSYAEQYAIENNIPYDTSRRIN